MYTLCIIVQCFKKGPAKGVYEPSSLGKKKHYEINLRSVKQPLTVGTVTTNTDMLSFKVSSGIYIDCRILCQSRST